MINLYLAKETKNVMVKRHSLSQVVLAQLVHHLLKNETRGKKKRMKLEYFITQYTKINSKCITDLSVRPETKTPRGKHRQNTL